MAGSLGFKAVALPLLGAALLAGGPALAQSPPGSKPKPVASPIPASVAKPTEAPSEKAPAAPKGKAAAATSEKAASTSEKKVLISEVVIQGLEGHPERERLELALENLGDFPTKEDSCSHRRTVFIPLDPRI